MHIQLDGGIAYCPKCDQRMEDEKGKPTLICIPCAKRAGGQKHGKQKPAGDDGQESFNAPNIQIK